MLKRKIIIITLYEDVDFKFTISIDEKTYKTIKNIIIKSKRNFYYATKQEKKELEYIETLKKPIGKDMYKTLLEKLELNEELINNLLER